MISHNSNFQVISEYATEQIMSVSYRLLALHFAASLTLLGSTLASAEPTSPPLLQVPAAPPTSAGRSEGGLFICC